MQIWNDVLGALAQNYADMCIWGHNADRHTKSTTFTFVGENLAITTADPGNYTGLVNTWFDEIQDFDYAANACGAVCGHYTQVWVGPVLTDKIRPSRTVFVNKNGP